MPRPRGSSQTARPFLSAPTLLDTSIKTYEMAVAAPIVVAIRLTRMAAGGPSPSRRDQTELRRMGQEKLDASVESMRATVAGVSKANERALRNLARTAPDWAGATGSWLASLSKMPERSLAPFHRRVMSNTRRLLKY